MSQRYLYSEGLDELGYERLDMHHVVNLTTGEIVDVDLKRDKWAKPIRPVRCGWVLGDSVSLHHDEGMSAHWSGLEHCGSIWACPVCSSVIRSERAEEIGKAVAVHQREGGTLLFVTLTLRHSFGDDLNKTLDAVLKSWSKTITGAPWNRAKERLAISGYIRSTEVTYGKNGWHPHIHAILFLDRELSATEFKAFRSWLFARWADKVEATGCRRPLPQGLNMQLVDKKGKVLAKYISKLQDEGHAPHHGSNHWGVDAEMARGDVKKARDGGITPFQLLDDCDDEDERMKRAALWRVYYRATKGRRCITWSRGLKERYGIDEKTDDEIIDDTEAEKEVWVTSAKAYRALRSDHPELVPVMLEAVERNDLETVAKWLPGSVPDTEH